MHTDRTEQARELLATGLEPADVAKQLGMSPARVIEIEDEFGPAVTPAVDPAFPLIPKNAVPCWRCHTLVEPRALEAVEVGTETPHYLTCPAISETDRIARRKRYHWRVAVMGGRKPKHQKEQEHRRKPKRGRAGRRKGRMG